MKRISAKLIVLAIILLYSIALWIDEKSAHEQVKDYLDHAEEE